MVANYRCNEIKDEAEKLVEPKLTALYLESSRSELANFREKAVSILSEAVQHYS